MSEQEKRTYGGMLGDVEVPLDLPKSAPSLASFFARLESLLPESLRSTKVTKIAYPPGLLSPKNALARWAGGIGRRGHQGTLRRALASMLAEMDHKSTTAVLDELEADAFDRECVLTGIRNETGLDFKVIDLNWSYVFYRSSGREKRVSRRRIENILSELRPR